MLPSVTPPFHIAGACTGMHPEHNSTSSRKRDSALLLMMFAVFLLASPFFRWWAVAGVGWYFPYLVWGAVISLTFWINRRRADDL